MSELPIVVVGGGLAGLTAAAIAARSGVPVSLLERSGDVGGRARSTRHEGCLLNLGPHGLSVRGAGTRILEAVGVDLSGRSPQRHRTRFLVRGRLVHPLDRRSGGLGFGGLVSIQRLTSQARRGDPEGAVGEWLQTVTDEQTRTIALATSRLGTYADAPDVQAADLAAEGFRSQVRYLDGGWSALVTQLATVAARAGARIEHHTPVRQIAGDGEGRPFLVTTTGGDSIRAAAVIIASGGPRHALGILPGESREALRRLLEGREPVTMPTLDLALRRRPPLPSLILGVDEPLYLSVQSDRSRVAPAGSAVVQLAKFLPVGESVGDGVRQQLEGLMDAHAPGWRADVIHARYLPGLTVTHDACLVSTGGRRGRIPPDATGMPGLYLAGDWIGGEGMLAQASIASAARAADLAVAFRRQLRSEQVALR